MITLTEYLAREAQDEQPGGLAPEQLEELGLVYDEPSAE